MTELRTNQDGRCPVCRKRIDGVMVGSFNQDFADLGTKGWLRSVYLAWMRRLKLAFIIVFILPVALVYHNARCVFLFCVLLGAAALARSVTPFTSWALWLATMSVALGWFPWLVLKVFSIEVETGAQFSMAEAGEPCSKRALQLVVALAATAAFALPYVV